MAPPVLPDEKVLFAHFFKLGLRKTWTEEENENFVKIVIEYITHEYRNENIQLSQPLLNKFIQIVKEKQEKSGRVAVEVTGKVLVFGDIHGKFAEMFTELCALFFVEDDQHGDYVKRDTKVLYLGDYVDRGPESIRCLLLLFGLQYLFPNQVTLLRGNHEEKDTNAFNTFKTECDKRYKYGHGKFFFELWNEIFDYLPVMGRINKKIICMHGGCAEGIIKSNYTYEDLCNMKYPIHDKELLVILGIILWSDPYKKSEQNDVVLIRLYMPNGARGAGETFDKAGIDAFLEKLGGQLIVRGHQKVPNGFEKYTDNFVTLFSAIDYMNSSNTASVLLVHPNGHFEIHEFEPPQPKNKEEADNLFTVDEVTVRQKKSNKAAIVATGAVAGVIALYGTYSLATASGTVAVNSQSSVQDLFAQKALLLSRVVNGVSLSEILTRGPFNEQQLLNELFPLGPTFNVTSLGNSSFSNLPQEIQSIQNVIGNECTGDNGCGVGKAMMDHMKRMELKDEDSVNLQKMISDVKANGTIDVDLMIGNATAIIQSDFPMKFEARIADVMKHATQKDPAFLDFVSALGSVNTDMKVFPGYLDDLKALESVSKVVTKYRDTLVLISKHIKIQSFKEELINGEAKFKKLRDMTTSEFAKDIKVKLDNLVWMDLSDGIEKTMTAGFPKGFEDLNKVFNDTESKWFKEFFHLATDLKALSSRLKQLKKLTEEVGPLQLSWKKVDFESASQSLNAMKSYVDNFGIFSKFSDLISNSLGCVKELDMQNKFMVDVDSIIDSLNSTTTYFKDIGSSIDKFSSVLLQFAELLKKLNNTKDLEELIRNANIIQDVQRELKSLIAKIQSKKDEIETSLEIVKTFDSKIVAPFEAWRGTVNFPNLVTCIRQQKFQETVDQMNPFAQKMAVLKPGSPEVATISTLVTSLDKLTTEVKKVKITHVGNTRQKRSTGQVRLERPLEDPKVLGDISWAVQKLVTVKKHEADLKNVIAGKKTIFDAIDKIQDDNEKKRVKDLWNDGTMKSLENMLEVASKLDEQIRNQEELKVVTDFKDPFNKAAEVRESTVNMRKLVKSLKGKIQDKKLAGSLDSLKTLDLKFAKYDKGKIEATLGTVHAFFDSILGIKRVVESSTEAPASSNTMYIVLGAVGGVVLLGGGVGYFFYRKQQQKKEKKKDDKKPTPSTTDQPVVTSGSTAAAASSSNGSIASDSKASAPNKEAKQDSYKSQKVIPKGMKVTKVGGGFQLLEKDGWSHLEHCSGKTGWRKGKGPVKDDKVVVQLPENYKGKMTQEQLNEAAKELEKANFNTEAILQDKRDPIRRRVTIKPWTRAVLNNTPPPPQPTPEFNQADFNIDNWQDNLKVFRYETGVGRDIVADEVLVEGPAPQTEATQSSENSDKLPRTSRSSSGIRKSTSNTKTAEEDVRTAASGNKGFFSRCMKRK